jgi:hypothetical protein
MWNDPIVAEIRAARRRHTDRFFGDVRAICEDIRKREMASGRKFVTFATSSSKAMIAPLPASGPEPDSSVPVR